MTSSSQIFGTNQRGELQELYEDLNDLNFERKKEVFSQTKKKFLIPQAVKKVIAYMTVGKDVSALFQSVIKCLEYSDIELKKLVYLYIVNYSRQKPDDAIMVINLFRKDVRKTENPLVRALAVRSFGCLRVPKLNDYLIEPLKEAMQDEDAYVRKTAVLCVPKVFEVSDDLVINNGLINLMKQMLQKESNALVLANLVTALKEIGDLKGENLIVLNRNIIQKLLLALNECIEWGQIFILDFLAQYRPIDSQEAELIIERVLPRLSHINPAVVFSTFKVILRYLDILDDGELVRNLCKKITPSLSIKQQKQNKKNQLVSLLSWNQPELQYVILRNISIILQKYPILFEKDVKVFFCGFNEPYYVKNEKLDIMVRICDNKNFQQVLTELQIYLNEVDTDFVRKSIKAIGRIAIRYDKSIEKAVEILTEFGQNCAKQGRDDAAVQEVCVQMQQLYRRDPNLRNSKNSLKMIVELSRFASEPQSKAACMWIFGEFAEFIPNVLERITEAFQLFSQEERLVQLQILTSAVKLFLKYPSDCGSMIQELLSKATQSFNPDVVDRAYIYWRLLSTDPEKTKRLVCSQVGQPIEVHDKLIWETRDLDVALENMGSLGNLLHKLPTQLQRHKLLSVKPVSESKETLPPQEKPTESPQKEKKIEKPEEKQVQPPPAQNNPIQAKAQDIDILGLDLLGDAPVIKKQIEQVNNQLSFDLI